ncbi:MAG: hypothetical protein GXO35_04860, partial [Gammaproteobacteria bacterium]|nr:hypothetical protein [Gammaproteobacteria bacterium]
IQAVLSKPIDLILVTLYHFNLLFPIKQGAWQLNIRSQAPIGRGLGSSAAVILSILGNLIEHHKVSLSSRERLALAQRIESRQHGTSSGIDPATMIHGGLLQYQTGSKIIKLPAHQLNAWLIDTGAPDSRTGECVEHVKTLNDRIDWQAFNKTTNTLIQALSDNKVEQFKQGIRQNHQLLILLGVVPSHIQIFIESLHQTHDAAAKICGAGAVYGDKAGMVICFSQQPPSGLCHDYGFSCEAITLQPKGMQIERLTSTEDCS